MLSFEDADGWFVVTRPGPIPAAEATLLCGFDPWASPPLRFTT
jgi:hypothetical protein